MKRKTTNYQHYAGQFAMAASLLCAGSVLAGTAVFDFNSDPLASGLLQLYGNGPTWDPTGGVGSSTNSNDGHLVITGSSPGQSGTIIFADFDQGQVVKAFDFEADLKIGNGHQNPADGFSINYARANDPILDSVAQGGSPTGWSQGQNCEANLPEEGTQTGIAIGFDAWDSGGTAGQLCGVIDQSIGVDVAAVTVRVDGTLVAQFPMPTRNGSCTDATSLQTGPYDANNPGAVDGLCWAHLRVQLTEDAKLNVWWKGVQLLSNYQTAYFPSPGALIFGGRTGDNYQNQLIDNIRITTIPAAVALVGAATGHPLGFSLTVNDSGNSVVDTTKPITLKLNNNTVTGATIAKVGGLTTVTYRGTQLLAIGATNQVEISLTDTNGNIITGSPTFVTPAYLMVPASYKATADTAAPGFLVKPYQTDAANPNRLYWTEEQLMGLHGPNKATQSSVNYNGPFDFSNDATLGNNGQFTTDQPWSTFGIPLLDPDSNNSSLAAMAYAYFPTAGLYTFGGNSDDGIRLAFSPNAQSLIGLEVPGMTADVGRGIAANQNQGYVWIDQPGYYGFRFLFENGTGGANVELYTKATPTSTTNVIAGNTADTQSLKVYRTATDAPAYISYAIPPMNDDQVGPGQDFKFQITETANPVSNVAVKVDNAAQTANSSKAGNVTTTTVAAPLSGWATGSHTLTITYQEGTQQRTNQYTFAVAGTLFVLDPAQAAPLGTQDNSKPGFVGKIIQTDKTGTVDIPNYIYIAEQILTGAWHTNFALATNFDAAGVINYDINGGAQGNFTVNNGFPEDFYPGIPGVSSSLEAFAVEFTTWLEFKTNGVYILNFNSDDGFLLSEGLSVSPDAGQLQVLTPASIAGNKPTVWSPDGGIALASNTAPITAQVVLMKGADPLGCAAPSNAAELVGKIALVERGTCEFTDKAKNALNAGAVAVVIGTSRPEVSSGDGWFPTEPGVGAAGRQPIPMVMIDRDSYMAMTNAMATGPVTATLHPFVRSGTPIVEANVGKGASDVTRYVRVTQPGLYPIRIVHWQGGGGGNAEFEITDPNGVRTLVNDLTQPNPIRAFEAVSFTRPTLSLNKVGNSWQITYAGGTLQSSANAASGYQDVAGATSPYTVDTSTGSRFFRVRQ